MKRGDGGVRIASSVGTSQRLLMDSLRFKVNQRPVHATRQLARLQDYSGDFGAAGEASRNLIWLRTKYQCCLALICQDTKLGPLLRASARRAKAVTFCFPLTGERTGSHLTVFCFVLFCFVLTGRSDGSCVASPLHVLPSSPLLLQDVHNRSTQRPGEARGPECTTYTDAECDSRSPIPLQLTCVGVAFICVVNALRW